MPLNGVCRHRVVTFVVFLVTRIRYVRIYSFTEKHLLHEINVHFPQVDNIRFGMTKLFWQIFHRSETKLLSYCRVASVFTSRSDDYDRRYMYVHNFITALLQPLKRTLISTEFSNIKLTTIAIYFSNFTRISSIRLCK